MSDHYRKKGFTDVERLTFAMLSGLVKPGRTFELMLYHKLLKATILFKVRHTLEAGVFPNYST